MAPGARPILADGSSPRPGTRAGGAGRIHAAEVPLRTLTHRHNRLNRAPNHRRHGPGPAHRRRRDHHEGTSVMMLTPTSLLILGRRVDGKAGCTEANDESCWRNPDGPTITAARLPESLRAGLDSPHPGIRIEASQQKSAHSLQAAIQPVRSPRDGTSRRPATTNIQCRPALSSTPTPQATLATCSDDGRRGCVPGRRRSPHNSTHHPLACSAGYRVWRSTPNRRVTASDDETVAPHASGRRTRGAVLCVRRVRWRT